MVSAALGALTLVLPALVLALALAPVRRFLVCFRPAVPESSPGVLASAAGGLGGVGRGAQAQGTLAAWLLLSVLASARVACDVAVSRSALCFSAQYFAPRL